MKALAHWVLPLAVWLFASNSAHAQGCYFPVEQMPELLSGGGARGIVQAIAQHATYPPAALRAGVQGRVFAQFTITPAGGVRDLEVVKSLRPDCDSVVLKAIQQLRFKPRPQKLGNVRYTVPITFNIPPLKAVVKPRRAASHKPSL
jgi:TonB family protein